MQHKKYSLETILTNFNIDFDKPQIIQVKVIKNDTLSKSF